MALIAEQLTLHIAGFALLRDISMTVAAGQVTAVVGPNGAGKTSLLRALSGELALTSGSVKLNGRPLEEWESTQRARMMAVLPQHLPLNFPFTAAEVVSLGRIPHKTGRERDAEIVKETLTLLDTRYLDQRFYTQMSGGERQRVQLARVLAQIWEPVPEGDRVLILDEPTAAFDLSHQNMTLDIVQYLAEQGIAILMVVHDLNLAARCADNLVVLNCGGIAAQGAPGDVLNESLIRDVFGVEAHIIPHPLHSSPLVIT